LLAKLIVKTRTWADHSSLFNRDIPVDIVVNPGGVTPCRPALDSLWQHNGFVNQIPFQRSPAGARAMRTSSATSTYDQWTQPSYEIRVRGTTPPKYLWGSAGVKPNNIKFDKPLILHIHNNKFGEEIIFGTQIASGTQTILGSLQPGECVSIPLQDISGVFATCLLESTVACLIKGL
jgi:hypothetical protein